MSADADTVPLHINNGDALLRQSFELFINPEIGRRREAGRIDETFGLSAAQVIFNADAPLEVRFNDEVEGHIEGVIERDIREGDDVELSDIERITRFDLTTEDPNAAHITVFYAGDGWLLISDLRFNAERADHHAKVAAEYIDAARHALEAEHLSPFVENLYAATELIAKGTLLSLPHETLLHKPSHSFIEREYSYFTKYGSGDPVYAWLHARLKQLRQAARYMRRSLDLTAEDAREMLATAERMLDDLRARTPRRHPADQRSG